MRTRCLRQTALFLLIALIAGMLADKSFDLFATWWEDLFNLRLSIDQILAAALIFAFHLAAVRLFDRLSWQTVVGGRSTAVQRLLIILASLLMAGILIVIFLAWIFRDGLVSPDFG